MFVSCLQALFDSILAGILARVRDHNGRVQEAACSGLAEVLEHAGHCTNGQILLPRFAVSGTVGQHWRLCSPSNWTLKQIGARPTAWRGLCRALRNQQILGHSHWLGTEMCTSGVYHHHFACRCMYCTAVLSPMTLLPSSSFAVGHHRRIVSSACQLRPSQFAHCAGCCHHSDRHGRARPRPAAASSHPAADGPTRPAVAPARPVRAGEAVSLEPGLINQSNRVTVHCCTVLVGAMGTPVKKANAAHGGVSAAG
jgi:hypothetical protein